MEDSLTSGRITVVCAPEAYALVTRERDQFQALYPQARIEIRPGSSQAALTELFAARCDLAVITRELSQVEREAAVRGRLGLEGYRFARDALVAVVNPGNPVENVSVPDLTAIYEGRETSWSGLAGGRGEIHPVVQPMESDVTAFFSQEILGGGPIRARVLSAGGDSAVVALVSGDPQAVGYVTLQWARRGARPLRLASLTGLPYTPPDLESVYQGRYPLTRFYNLYVRTGGPPLADGFITFITSRTGQKVVQDFGLVPTSVPVRFARRSPLLKSH